MRHKADKALAAVKTSLARVLQTNTGVVLYAIAWLVSLAAAFAGLEPLILVGLMLAYTTLAALSLYSTDQLGRTYERATPLFLTLLAFAVYVFLSSLWSAYPQLAVEKGSLIFLVVLGVGFTPLLIDQMSPLQLHRGARGILIGLLVAMIFLGIEYATDHATLNFVAKEFPGLVKIIPATQQIPSYHLNPNASVTVLFLWPALHTALGWQSKRVPNLFVIALLASSLFLLYMTESATAQLAFVFATLVYLAARHAPRHIDLIARSLWAISVLGVVPMVLLVHASGLQNNTSLPYSFRDRIHIWHHTAELVPQNPILGIGIRSNRSYKKGPGREIPGSLGGKLVDHQGWHSHNLFLQTWYELGVIGAVFLLAMGLFMLKRIRRIERKNRPFAYGLFASFGIIAAFGYGMWQSWLLAAYGWSVIFLLIGLRYGGEEGMDHGSSPESEPN